MNNKEDQASVLGPTSTLVKQINEGFEAPLRNVLPVAYVA